MTPVGGADIDTYSATPLPSGLTFDDAIGAISGTPDAATDAPLDVTVTFTDANGNSVDVAIPFPAVAKGDQVLTWLGYNPATITYGDVVPALTAPTGAVTALSYATTTTDVCSVDGSTGALTVLDKGDCTITVTAESTADYNGTTDSYTVIVQSLGTLALNVDLIAEDDVVNIAEKADGITITGDTGTETGVTVTVTVGATALPEATSGSDGSWSVDVPADASYLTEPVVAVAVAVKKTGYTSPEDATRDLTIDLSGPTAPSYTPPESLQVGVAIAEIIPAGGADISTYEATALPSGLTFDDAIGAISGTPDAATDAPLDVTVTVTDSAGNAAEVNIPLPLVEKGDQVLTGFAYSATSVTFGSVVPTVTAPTGAETALSYSTTNTDVCTVDATTGALTLLSPGDCTITVTAESTADYNEETDSYTVTVLQVGTLALNVDVIAEDDVVNIAEKATGFTITGDTGEESDVDVTLTIGSEEFTARSIFEDSEASWSVSVPADADYLSGTSLEVVVNVTKTGFTSPAAVERTLGIDLSGPTAPSYTPPESLQVGVEITEMTPEGGSDINTYEATALPSGLTFNNSTGAISGTPDIATETALDVTVTVKDASGNAVSVNIPFPLVDKGDQTLEGFGYAESNVRFTAKGPSLIVPVGAQTTLEYTTTTSDVCTVDLVTGELRLLEPGDCTIVATAVGTKDYHEASATFTLSVQAIQITLILDRTNVRENADPLVVNLTARIAGGTRDEATRLDLNVGEPSDNATADIDYVSVSDLRLTIPAGQLSAGTSFTLTVLEDMIDEPDEVVSITGTTVIDGYEVVDAALVILDNDDRGITVSRRELTLTEGGVETYTLVLNTEPTANLTATPTVSGSPDVSFEPSTLTFTTSNWSTPQTMTVTAVEDDDASHDSTFVWHRVEGADYDGYVGGQIAVTITDDEQTSADVPTQVTGLTAVATTTHVDLTWTAVQSTPLGYRIEASYDDGAHWALIDANTESIETRFRHPIGLSFAATRNYRISAVNDNGAGLPSVMVQTHATYSTAELSAVAVQPAEDSTVGTDQDLDEQIQAIDVCWQPEGVAVNELREIALAWTPASQGHLNNLGNLPWRPIYRSSLQANCEDGVGFRVTPVSENQRYAFRMRATHDGVWLVSNRAEAEWKDISKPLRAVVTSGASGLSGDTPVPDLVCHTYDDPATREDEAGAFYVTVGFTEVDERYVRYSPVHGFDHLTDLTLVNATAELLKRPYDPLLGYRVQITPIEWGEPVAVSVAANVVTHIDTDVGNEASDEFTRQTSDATDCEVDSGPPRRAQVIAATIEEDGDRSGAWSAGEPIRIKLRFDERVVVITTAGVPSVNLLLGEQESSVTAPYARLDSDDTLVFEYVVAAESDRIVDVDLVANSLVLNGATIDSYSGPAVDLSHHGVTVVDGIVERPNLTSAWTQVPSAHQGAGNPFSIELSFSEAVGLIAVIGEQRLIDHAFTVSGGRLDAIRPARDRYGEYLLSSWSLQVTPVSEEVVTLTPLTELACDQPGAICTIDDRMLVSAPSISIHRTAHLLSVTDAEVAEAADAELVFEVTLRRPADRPISVDYQTVDGTALAGEDFDAVSGTLQLDVGQSTGSVRVQVLDDDHDEGEETLYLVLTNAVNAQIEDGEARGTIVNSDPIPNAWLARFGRVASDHVVQAVSRRLERRQSETDISIAGIRLDSLAIDSAAMTHAYDVPRPTIDSGLGSNNFVDDSTTRWSGGREGVRFNRVSPFFNSFQTPDHVPLRGSFLYTQKDDEYGAAGPWSAWGETAFTQFSGNDSGLSLRGEIGSTILGLDRQYERWLVGASLAYSTGEGTYAGTTNRGGTILSTLTSLHPYAHVTLTPTTSLWGVLGAGTGNLQLDLDGAASVLKTGLSNRMLAFGGRGTLTKRLDDASWFESAVRSDVLLTHTQSVTIEGLRAAHGATSRVRLMFEGTGSFDLTRGTLRPNVEAGLRVDGGDAETGAGIELGGSLMYRIGRFDVEINARELVAHQDRRYEESGISGSFGYRAQKDGQGLSLRISSAWGATQSELRGMWRNTPTAGLEHDIGAHRAHRNEVEVGYGWSRRSVFWSPFLAIARDGRNLRTGLRLNTNADARATLEMSRLEDVIGDTKVLLRLKGQYLW